MKQFAWINTPTLFPLLVWKKQVSDQTTPTLEPQNSTKHYMYTNWVG